MGMSTNVFGFRPPDEKWLAMKAIWDSCEAAGVEVPDKVNEFFDWEGPDAAGVRVEIPAKKYASDCEEGFEIAIADLPKDIVAIRFVNSY